MVSTTLNHHKDLYIFIIHYLKRYKNLIFKPHQKPLKKKNIIINHYNSIAYKLFFDNFSKLAHAMQFIQQAKIKKFKTT